MDSFDKFGRYAPIVAQILMTILIVNHWYRDLNYIPLLVFWCILLGLSISPILDLIYGNNDENVFHDDYNSSRNIHCRVNKDNRKY